MADKEGTLLPEDDVKPEKKSREDPLVPIVGADELAEIRAVTRQKKTKVARRGDAKEEIAAFLKKIHPETRTGKEIEEELDMLHETVSAALIKLRKAKRVERLTERRKNATGRFSRAYRSREHKLAADATCARCGTTLAEWPIKSLDKGDHAALDIAPKDRAFKKAIDVDGQSKQVLYCARCLRKPKVLKRVLAGRLVKRVKLKTTATPEKPKKTFKKES